MLRAAIERITEYIKFSLIILFRLCVILPLAYIIPKKRNLAIFVGSHSGLFFDNAKYLFLYLHGLRKKDMEYYFLTEDKNIFDELNQEKLPALLYKRFYTIIKMLRANILISDSNEWSWKIGYHFLLGSYKVQLWHGVGFKRLIINKPEDFEILKSFKGKLVYYLRGRLQKYDLFISTSEFYSQNVFSKSANFDTILETGYPRNDSFFVKPDKYSLLGADREAFNRIINLKDKYKITLFIPTFRDSGGDPINDKALNISRLSRFAKENNFYVILKFHNWKQMAGPIYDVRFDNVENVIRYDPAADIYPALPLTDFLITDYSSVYMDYLFLNKPILFFPYDYVKYIKKDREVQFDYNWITPGPKCHDQDELEGEIKNILNGGNDKYAEKRKEISDLAFKYKDGKASERIWGFIKENYMK